ncbi:MAG: autotransporter outer membrane beta-barrel domain-containing protein, partial [Desulfobaccales bacterium]
VGGLTLQGDGSGFTGTVLVPSDKTLSGNGAYGGGLNLQGDGSGYGGAYTVTNNTFNLDNTIGGAPTPCTVLINPNGTMTGNGTLVGTLTNKGTISPGKSPGALSVVGSYTQTASGTYLAEIASPSSYDKIVVTGAPGTATLAGTLAPTLLGGYRPLGNTLFPGVLTATGGLTGTFNTMLNQQISPTLFWQPRYSATSFDLLVERDYTNPGLGLNSNQLAVGTMLNGLAGATSGDLSTVLNAIDSLPASANVQDAYKQISPEKAGALAGLGFVAATFQMRNLANRTTNLRFVQGESGGSSGLTSGGLSCNYSNVDGVMLAYNGASLSNLFSARKDFTAPESRWGFFADGGAAFGSQNSSVNQTGYNFTLGGFTVGADYRLQDNLLVGLATGYSNTSSSFYGSGGRVTANTIPFNAYAAYFPGSIYAYGSLGYALNLFDLKRGINFGDLGRTASSSTTGNQFNLYGETGYDLKLSRFILTPAATLAYSALGVGGFTEQGADSLNLKVAPQNANSVQTGVGGRLTVPLKMGSVQLVPQGYAFYQHEFANGSRGLNASLSQGSSTFNFQTDAAQRNFALVGASVTVGLKKNLYAQVNYNAEVGRSNSTVQYVDAGLRLEF